MLEPDTDMLGEVAGELLANWNHNSLCSAQLTVCISLYNLVDCDELTDLESVDNERILTANNRGALDQIETETWLTKMTVVTDSSGIISGQLGRSRHWESFKVLTSGAAVQLWATMKWQLSWWILIISIILTIRLHLNLIRFPALIGPRGSILALLLVRVSAVGGTLRESQFDESAGKHYFFLCNKMD